MENPIKQSIAEQERQRNLASGREILMRQNINPDDYEGYFQIMSKNDVPVINKLPQFNFIRDIESLGSSVLNWEELKSMYDKIDMEKQDENTGRDIILEMKSALSNFDLAFRQYVESSRQAGVISPPPDALLQLRSKVIDLARKYTDEVPAYRAYRWYGRFKLDSQGRRGFQMNETVK